MVSFSCSGFVVAFVMFPAVNVPQKIGQRMVVLISLFCLPLLLFYFLGSLPRHSA